MKSWARLRLSSSRPLNIVNLCRLQTGPFRRCNTSPLKYSSWRLPSSPRMSSSQSTESNCSGPPPFEYVPLESVERLERYQPGGYHPVEIGHVLRNWYQIVHKLGYGTYSTTWLCRDHQRNKYAAVKIGTGDSSTREADMLDRLRHTKISSAIHPGERMILPVQDRFVVEGPNGVHPCYVTAPASCSIAGAKDGSYIRLF